MFAINWRRAFETKIIEILLKRRISTKMRRILRFFLDFDDLAYRNLTISMVFVEILAKSGILCGVRRKNKIST
jgi:hypothetical protein